MNRNRIKTNNRAGLRAVTGAVATANTVTTATLLMVLLAGLLQSCAPPPIPGELLTAQRLYNNARIDDELKEGAPELWEKHEEFYHLAEKMWLKRQLAEAKEAARIATIIYNTAIAEVNRLKIETGISTLKQQLTEAQRSVDIQRRMAASLSDDLAHLRNNIRLAKEIEELRKYREIERVESERKLARQQALTKERSRHGSLLIKMKEAEDMGAATHSEELYQVATTSMNKAHQALEEENLPAATASLDMAQRAITQAMEWASPIHQAEQTRQEQAQVTSSLLARATALGDLQVRNEPRGVVIILEDIFGTTSRTNLQLTPQGSTQVLAIARMLENHRDLEITIEGHTDNALPGEKALNLTTAQAAAVKELMVKETTLDGNLLSPAGYGSKANLTDNSTPKLRSQNRRIEVVIHTHKPGQ